MDDPSETPDAFIAYVRHQIDTRSSQAEVGEALSPRGDRSWLTRILRKQRRFSLSRLFMILRELGVSETEFFRGYIETIGPFDASVRTARPQDLLRRARGEQGVSVDCLDRVQGKSIKPLGPDAPLYGVPDRSREIDALRESDRETALYRAEIWVLEILATIKPGHTLQGAKVAELASALGVWASVARLLGRALVSARALEIALDLHGAHRWSPAYADLLERSAVTLKDLGVIEDALDLALGAFALRRTAGDAWSEAKAMLSFGTLASQAGRSELARSVLERCLEFPELDDPRRAAALDALAATEINEGRLDKAREYLDATLALNGLAPRIELQIRWQQARLDLEEGRFELGAQRLEALMDEAEPHFEPIDQFLLFLDLAEVLKHMGAQGRFNRYAAKMSRLLPLLENQPMALAVAGRFLDTALLQPLKDLAVEETRNELLEAKAKRQPNGSA